MSWIGIDIIEISRVQSVITRWGDHFLHRVYTESELALCRGRAPALAARFAAKEAVMKAFGTGTRGAGWRDIEVLSDSEGKPIVNLYGRAREKADRLDFGQLAISLSHSREHAVACVTATSQ